MAWYRLDDKPSSELMMDCRCFVSSICVTRLQWVNELLPVNTGYVKLPPRTDKTGSCFQEIVLSGVPDLFDRSKILSGGDLSH